MQQPGSTSSIIRVLIVANSVIMQAGLEALIATSPTLEVVGSSASPTALIQQVEQLQPDVVLLEWDEPEGEPILPLLDSNLAESLAIVILINDWQQTAVTDLIRSGVQGILPSAATAGEIVGAVEAAAIGLVVLHPDLLDSLRFSPAAPRLSIETQPLTAREIEVLRMLAEGLGNKTIARRLEISEHTVKFHIGSIFSKLNASSRTEAVMMGARQGLVLL